MKREALLDCYSTLKACYGKPWARTSVDLAIEVRPSYPTLQNNCEPEHFLLQQLRSQTSALTAPDKDCRRCIARMFWC